MEIHIMAESATRIQSISQSEVTQVDHRIDNPAFSASYPFLLEFVLQLSFVRNQRLLRSFPK
jgi:hypothetical protein